MTEPSVQECTWGDPPERILHDVSIKEGYGDKMNIDLLVGGGGRESRWCMRKGVVSEEWWGRKKLLEGGRGNI